MTVATYDLRVMADDASSLAAHLNRAIAFRQSGNDVDERADMASAVDELRAIAAALGFEIVPIDAPVLQVAA